LTREPESITEWIEFILPKINYYQSDGKK